jgi:hypothetical protein
MTITLNTRCVLHGGQVRNRNEALLLLQISCAGRKMDQLVRLFITELQQGDARALLAPTGPAGLVSRVSRVSRSVVSCRVVCSA